MEVGSLFILEGAFNFSNLPWTFPLSWVCFENSALDQLDRSCDFVVIAYFVAAKRHIQVFAKIPRSLFGASLCVVQKKVVQV